MCNIASYHKHYHPSEQSGVCVVRRDGESDEDFVKRFRKKFSKSGISKEFKDRMYFEKPSDKKRRKRIQSIRLIQREEEKALEMKDRYARMKAKRKKIQDKERRKKERRHDQRSSRQNSSGIPEDSKE